jgi:DNA-binding XRE family transcriptional regulator
MTIIEKISQMKQQEGKRHDAMSAATAIVQMDPDAREDLISYLHAFNEAKAANDEQEQEYLIKAILEVFNVDEGEDGSELEDWQAEVRSSPKGRQAAKQLFGETERFFAAYQHFKAQSGLSTIRKLAQAAGISPTTVQAIEKQKVKPQFKTIQALARAFGVAPEKLNQGKE